MKRIAILGSSCSGKTTLSRRLQEKLGYKLVEFDAINWLPNWQEREYGEFRDIVEQETRADTWITDGNYISRVGAMVIERADTIIWLKLPFLTIYMRLIPRLFRRIVRNEELWNGNRETLRLTLFHKDSLLYWIPRTWQAANAKLQRLFEAELPGKTKLVFHSAREVETWLDSLPAIRHHPVQ